MTASADHAAQRGLAEKLGIEPGAVVQVVGGDGDVDQALLDDVAARSGTELITADDSDDVVDVVLLWWREGDGDLVDALVDSLTNLGDSGVVWLLTPKAGRDGHVEPSDIEEAAPTAGLSSTRSTSAAPEWSGHPAGVAQGGPQQDPALTPRARPACCCRTPAGPRSPWPGGLDLSPAGRIAAAEAVRAAAGPELGPLALEQALLRARARAKHPRGDELWWTGEALEQATSYAVAVHRARRFDRPVLDLCCSVGGDLLALPEGSVGVDLDEARLLLARANAARARPAGVPGARRRARARPGRRRVRRPGAAQRRPPGLRRPGLHARRWTGCWPGGRARMGVKVAPGIDWSRCRPTWRPRSCRSAATSRRRCCGRARPGGAPPAARRCCRPATRSPTRRCRRRSGAAARSRGSASRTARWSGPGSSRRSRTHVGGGLLDATIAYVTADAPVPTPYGHLVRGAGAACRSGSSGCGRRCGRTTRGRWS